MSMNNKLSRNIVYNMTYQILTLILPFVTAPYLSRVLGADGIGLYSYNQSIALYFVYFAVLGLSNYGNRSISTVQNDKEQRSRVFYEIYSMQIITATISILTYIIYTFTLAKNHTAAIIMLMWVISSVFDINWFFFGMEKFQLTVIRNIIIKVFTVLLIFCLIKSKEDVYLYIFIMSLGTLISQMALWPYLRRYTIKVKPKWKDIKQHFKPNLKLFIPIIASSIYNMLDKIMLGSMRTMTEVGYYENAEKIIKMIQSLIIAVGTVMLPRMTALFSQGKEESAVQYFDGAIRVILMYSSASIFGILAVGNSFVNIYYGCGFEYTSVLLSCLVVTILFFGMGNVLRTQYLIPKKKDSVFIVSSLIGAGINVCINAILIPIIGGLGAAIATVFTECSVCAYQFYKSKSEIHLTKYTKWFVWYTVFGFIMYLSIKVMPEMKNESLELIRDVVIGAAVYLSMIAIHYYINKRKGQ